MLSPAATRFVGPLSLRRPLPPSGRDRRAGPPARRADRPHRARRCGGRRSWSPRRPPTGWARWPTGWPATSSPRPASRRPRRSSWRPAMDGDMWTHPATRANVARLRDDFGYPIVEPGAGPLASGQIGRRAAGRARGHRRRGRRGRRPDRPIRAPDPARAPAARRARARRGPRRPAHRRDGRRHRASRSTRSASSATARPGRWAWPWSRPRWIAGPA